MLANTPLPADAGSPVVRLTRWAVLVAGAAVLVVLAFRLTHALGSKKAASPVAIPTVSVIRVGVSAQPTTIEVLGTVAARYDTPIGVEGDGGRVASISVEAGDHVKKGQVLARLSVSVLEPQVANLQAALEQARAEQELADAEYQRAVTVGAAGALSAEDTQRRKSSAVTAAAKVKLAQAQLAEAQARLARAEIRAPADGLILTRNVEVGQTVTPGGDPLFRLSEGGEVELRGQVAEQDLPLLQVGQDATVRLTGINQPFAGNVRLLGAVIDPKTRLGSVRIALHPDPALRPGAFARALVTVSKEKRAVVPQTAVLTDQQGTYVLVVTADNKVARRPVHVSGIVADGVTIDAGLPGDSSVVATAGAFLKEGEVVKPLSRDAGQPMAAEPATGGAPSPGTS
jgi:RND family efflux transporter MFP subunit